MARRRRSGARRRLGGGALWRVVRPPVRRDHQALARPLTAGVLTHRRRTQASTAAHTHTRTHTQPHDRRARTRKASPCAFNQRATQGRTARARASLPSLPRRPQRATRIGTDRALATPHAALLPSSAGARRARQPTPEALSRERRRLVSSRLRAHVRRSVVAPPAHAIIMAGPKGETYR